MEKEKAYYISGDLTTLKGILINLEEYGKLHPLITSVRLVDNEGSLFKKYKIIEKPYSWIPIKISYKAIVKVAADNIIYEILEIPFTKAFFYYEFVGLSNQEIEVKFKIKVGGKLIGKSLLMKKMLKAQDQLILEIKKVLKQK